MVAEAKRLREYLNEGRLIKMEEMLDGKNLLRASVERAEITSISGTEVILGSYATVRARSKVTMCMWMLDQS